MPGVNYAVRLRAPVEDLRRVCGDYALLADKVLCYQHDDDKDNIHCHLLLTNVYKTDETLKGVLRKYGLTLKGAGQLSYKTSFKDPETKVKLDITDDTIPKYITYMTKGKHDASYIKGFEKEYLDERKAAWVKYEKTSPQVKLYKEFEELIKEQEARRGVVLITSDLSDAITLATIFCMRKHKVMTRACRNDIAMLVSTLGYYRAWQVKPKIPFFD